MSLGQGIAPKCNFVNKIPEMQSQVEGVLNVLEECVEKFKISILMPQILQKWETIGRLLENTEYENCARLLRELVTGLKRNQTKSSASCITFNLYDPNLRSVVDAFQENYKIFAIIKDVLSIHSDDIWLVSALQTLCELAKRRFSRDAFEDLLIEKYMHVLYIDNEHIQGDIAKFRKKIVDSKNALRWRIAAKEIIVNKYEEELSGQCRGMAMFLDAEEKELNKKLRIFQIEFQRRHKEVAEDFEKSAESLAKTYKSNKKEAQKVRDERNKLMMQFQTLTKRYDKVLAEKFKLNMVLDKRFAELQHEFNEFLRNEYEKVERAHNDLVMALELKKQREFEIKLALFIRNRAAKIIQRFWRKYIKRMHEVRGKLGPKSVKSKKKLS